MKTIQNLIINLSKIFFVGLLLQFFAHTWVTHWLWISYEWMNYVWLRKEWMIAVLWILVLIWIIWSKWRKKHFSSKEHTFFLLILLVTVWVCALLHFYFVGWSVWAFAMAFKYDFLWFFILLIWVHCSHILTHEQRHDLIARYGKIIKYCLILALVWYFVIFIKPWTLKLFGYNNFVYEWLVWSAPPAVYYTQINRWLPRNQFLFERPITRGFFLTALRPLFYILFLHKKPFKETWLRWVFYGLNIIVTFSRAARWTWIIEIILMAFVFSKDWKKSLIKYWLPIFGIFLLISILWFDSIMNRWYSNYWHITMLKNWWAMFTSSPLIWVWWATAGPWSHWGWIPFNPENQFLQVMIEFGLIWFMGWLLLFGSLCIVWIKKWYKAKLPLLQEGVLLACSFWMIGLAISWMVLHSFSDRMVVYPFMLLFGIVLVYSHHTLKQ